MIGEVQLKGLCHRWHYIIHLQWHCAESMNQYSTMEVGNFGARSINGRMKLHAHSTRGYVFRDEVLVSRSEYITVPVKQ